MAAGRSRTATGEWRIAVMAVFAAFLSACTTGAETTFEMSNPSFAARVSEPVAGQDAVDDGSLNDTTGLNDTAGLNEPADATVSSEGDMPLPTTVAYLPASNPAGLFPAQPGMMTAVQPGSQADAASAADSAGETGTTAQAVSTASPNAQQAAAPAMNNPVYVTAADPQALIPAEPKKRGFLSSLFAPSQASATPSPAREQKPIIQFASTSKPVVTASLGSAGGSEQGSENALPGVRQTALFEIKRKSGIDDDSDVDLHEDEMPEPYQVASAAGLARLAPNGLLTQTDRVDVSCLKPSLVRVLKVIEQHYGRKMVVTSGYRSPDHNRRARGAKNSLHMYCAAADVQVSGVSKWELAKFVRTMPGRGGVGTYCHTESVHIDVGPERDWNWRCRRRAKR